jgi:hypothetical protein
MPNRLVTVQSFTVEHEAHLARNLLEAEGILAFLGGEMTAVALPGLVHLQVRATDAPRAVALLAAVALDDDWEERSTAGAWSCSVCGDAVPGGLLACSTCATPRDAVRPAGRGEVVARLPSQSLGSEGIQRLDHVTPGPPKPAPAATPLAARNGPLTVCMVLAPVLLALFGFLIYILTYFVR